MTDVTPNSKAPATELEVLETELAVIEETASLIVITDQGTYGMAEIIGKDLSAKKKKVVDHFKIRKAEANKVHKRICDDEKVALAPYNAVLNDIKIKMLGYEEEQAKIQREKERLARIEFDKKQKQKQKELAKQTEEMGYVPEEGIEEELTAEDIYIPPTVELKGSNRVTWSAEVSNLQDFYRGVITEGRWDLIEPNLKALGEEARERKAESNIPGVKFVSKTTKVL